MSKELHLAVESILAMPYYRNEAARSGLADLGHERAVAELLLRAGFDQVDRRDYPQLTKTLLKKWANSGQLRAITRAVRSMPAGSFILQPGGTQSFPDILIKDTNQRLIAIECKSGKKTTLMWNDRLPSLAALYVFSSQEKNATTIFLGQDIITEKEIRIQDRMIEELTEIMKSYQIKSKRADQFQRGWLFKFRPQNFQGGGLILSDYFRHPDRKKCENNALAFSKE